MRHLDKIKITALQNMREENINKMKKKDKKKREL